VGEGDFTVRVEGVNSRDEIGDLANRFNKMIGQLGQRLELMKFVSHGTMSAIQAADKTGMSRGGERRSVSVVFTDIRGYTEFSEKVSPEVVIEALNRYFDVQADVVKKYHGDVDKFIGDALVAVFEGDNKEQRAVSCSVEIIEAMDELFGNFPEYDMNLGLGVASGEVVMGAMGAHDRMDFTVLGSTVNLSARLCSKADPGQVLVDLATREASENVDNVWFEELERIPLKGFSDPVQAFAAHGVDSAERPDT
jgi:adenylate cyclase